MDTPHLASHAFADAYRALQQKRGSLPIGIGQTYEQLTRAGVPEEYAVHALQKDIVPATIAQLWENGVTLDFVDAFLNGREARYAWTTANAALREIIIMNSHLRNHAVPEDYALPLLRMGSAHARISLCWRDNIALEYAQQLVAEEVAEWNNR